MLLLSVLLLLLLVVLVVLLLLLVLLLLRMMLLVLLPIRKRWLLLRVLRRVHKRSRRWVVPVTRFPPPLVLFPPLLLLHRVCRHGHVPLPCVKPSPLLGGWSPAHAHHVPMDVFLRDQMAFAAWSCLRPSPTPTLSLGRMHDVAQRGRV